MELLLTEPTPWFQWKHTGDMRSWAVAAVRWDSYNGSWESSLSPVFPHNSPSCCQDDRDTVRLCFGPQGTNPNRLVAPQQTCLIRQNGSCQRGFGLGLNLAYCVIFILLSPPHPAAFIWLIFALVLLKFYASFAYGYSLSVPFDWFWHQEEK